MSTKETVKVKDGENTKHRFWLRSIKFINAVMITVPFALCWYLYYADRIWAPFYSNGDKLVVVMFIALYIMFGKIYSGFTISINHVAEIVYSQILAILFTNAIMYFVTWLLTKRFPNPLPMLAALVAECILSLIWSAIAHAEYFRRFKPIRTVIVYDMRKGLENLVNSYGLDKRFNVVETYHVSDVVDNMAQSLGKAEAVFLCGIHSHDRNKIIKYCVKADIRAYIIPRVGDLLMESAHPIHMFHLPILMLERYNPTPEYLIIKRAFDILVSGIALIILSPLMIVIAILIRRDGGTAFYRQKRLTKNGKEFYVLKFRSMRMDAEKDGVARLSSGENDDRITPIGHFIRACRIDELPQLINILRGDMSIVGPRPERPEIAADYEKELPEFALRLQAKAGLTGYAQVYGKYNTTPNDKLLMDLQYIAKPSFAEDLKIMFATVKILFMPESTEGIDANATNAMGDGSFGGGAGKEDSAEIEDDAEIEDSAEIEDGVEKEDGGDK